MRRSKSTSQRQRGQAIVEFALSVTLIFFMLSAAVDLGLAYFSYQALVSAAQEGASFGSGNWEDNDAIRHRVRGEAGPPVTAGSGGSGGVRINVVDTTKLTNAEIQVSFVPNNLNVGQPCPVMEYCDAVVNVSYQYKPFFFLAPVFGNSVTISAERSMTLHDESSAGTFTGP